MDVSSLKNQDINPRIIRPSDGGRSQKAKALKTPGDKGQGQLGNSQSFVFRLPEQCRESSHQ